MSPTVRRVAALALLAAAVAVVLTVCLMMPEQWPDAAWLQARRQQLAAAQAAQPLLFGLGFFGLFVMLSALALPGCSVLALGAGLCFGWAAGTVIVVLASTVGATLSFLAARYLFRDAVQRRWGERLAPLQARMSRDGALLLFSLRLAPVIPYPVLNPLMGLTNMRTRTFMAVSSVGMAAGSAAYVQAGTDLARWAQGGDLWSPALLAALAALALLPWLGRWWWRRLMRVQATHP